MKCEEVRPLSGPYLDSELDARTTLEIEQHLKACAECANLFADEEKLEARMKAGLSRGQKTAALWGRIERSVAIAELSTSNPGLSPHIAADTGLLSILAALGQQLQSGWRRSPRVWAALAAVWAVILVLNLTARESDGRIAAGHGVPSMSEMRSAWQQKQLWLAELAVIGESAPAAKPKPAPPSPRSDRRDKILNT